MSGHSLNTLAWEGVRSVRAISLPPALLRVSSSFFPPLSLCWEKEIGETTKVSDMPGAVVVLF